MSPQSQSPSPPFVSARVTNTLFPSMLSELAFDREPTKPLLVVNENENIGTLGAKSKEKVSSMSIFSSWDWNGLLCFSSSDPDLFFDAEEKPIIPEENVDNNGKIILTRTSVSCSEQSSESECLSVESVEVKLRKGGSVATICECRGGEQQQQQQQSPIGKVPVRQVAFGNPSEQQQQQQQAQNHNPFVRTHAPSAPTELPVRFLRAGKGDPIEGQRRYDATLQWRKEHNIDNILFEAHPEFEMIKKNYPHYFHLRGKQGEPVFFEQPPKTDLAALKACGVTLVSLVRHYTKVTEFQWQFIESNDFAQSITVLDLDGIRIMDFVGECVEYVKMCSKFTGQHYPERAGHVIVVNVPRWFSMIWNVVKPMVDDDTLKKISIVRGKDAVFAALSERIPVENIPPEYGGRSMKLGDSPEEHALRDLIAHNNALANGDYSCGGKAANPPCQFCSWRPVRSY